MDVFNQLIISLNREEQRAYKLLCARSHSKEQRKDIALFDYAKKAEGKYDESYILKRLYPSPGDDKNALYRLKNKVKSDVQRSLNYLNYDESSEAIIYNSLLLYRHFTDKQQYGLSLHYLRQAEKAATAAENFRLLDLIYSYAISLSPFYVEFNPQEYIAKRRQNEKRLALQNTMDEIYTRLNYQIKTSLNYSRERVSGAQLLKKVLGEYSRVKELKHNASFQIKIFKTLAQALVQQHNYNELLKYTQQSLESFESKGWLQNGNAEVKLQMLIYICNALYKLGRYFESLRYTAELKKVMEADAVLNDKYRSFYNSLLIYNYTQTDPKQAIEICNRMLQEMKRNANPQVEYITLINKSIAQWEARLYDDALGTLNRVFINDYFRKSDASFKLKVFMAEILLCYMAGDYKFCGQRLKRFKKQYASLLAKKDYASELSVLDIVAAMLNNVQAKTQNRKAVIQKMESFLQAKANPADEDTQIFKYRVWVTGQMAQLKR